MVERVIVSILKIIIFSTILFIFLLIIEFKNKKLTLFEE